MNGIGMMDWPSAGVTYFGVGRTNTLYPRFSFLNEVIKECKEE